MPEPEQIRAQLIGQRSELERLAAQFDAIPFDYDEAMKKAEELYPDATERLKAQNALETARQGHINAKLLNLQSQRMVTLELVVIDALERLERLEQRDS